MIKRLGAAWRDALNNGKMGDLCSIGALLSVMALCVVFAVLWFVEIRPRNAAIDELKSRDSVHEVLLTQYLQCRRSGALFTAAPSALECMNLVKDVGGAMGFSGEQTQRVLISINSLAD